MIKFVRDKKLIVLVILFLLSILPLLFSVPVKYNKPHIRELYNNKLIALNSMSKLLDYVDRQYTGNHQQTFDTLKYVNTVSQIIKERFYHGLSNYSIFDNWIASMSAKLAWNHLSAIVKPDDILKHSEGLCSQQTIVFLEVLKQKGIKARSVGLGYKQGPGHFLSEVYYNGSWHVYDVTMEPNWRTLETGHKSMEYYKQNPDSLYDVYSSKYQKTLLDTLIKKVEYGKVNEFPAKKMLVFHQVTKLLTYIIPAILFGLILLTVRNKKHNI